MDSTEVSEKAWRAPADGLNDAMISHARKLADEIGATAVLVYADVIRSRKSLDVLINDELFILAARTDEAAQDLSEHEGVGNRVVKIPSVELSRLSQIKVATILALSSGLIHREDRLVCLSGSRRNGILDSLRVVDVGREFEVFSAGNQGITKRMSYPHVFDRLLTIALELADEGKEGRPIGTIFVLGEHEKVLELSAQMVLNPFHGVPEEDRNLLNPFLKETIREFATIDGAFVIRDDGVIMSAGRHLKASAEEANLPQGLGARHRAAAGITALTDAMAVVISQSTGDVRVFSGGKIFMEVDKETLDRKYKPKE
jgi:DNA integrity scanning protein DisA with diadenylate cyclase activity